MVEKDTPPGSGFDDLRTLSSLSIPAPVRVSPPPMKIRIRSPESCQDRRFQTSLFGYDIRLVHALIVCINEHVQSKQKSISIDWEAIASSLNTPRKLTATECQTLWRFCAYHMDEFGRSNNKTIMDVSSLADDDSDIDLPTTRASVQTPAVYEDLISGTTDNPKRKWTNSTDIKLLQAIFEHGEDDWEKIKDISCINRDARSIEERWRVMQRSVEAGRYKNERVVALVQAIMCRKQPPPQDVQTAADAIASLMTMV